MEKIARPPLYNVVIHFDENIPSEVYIEVLQGCFYKTGREAKKIVVYLRKNGTSVVDFFSSEVAESKVLKVTNMARGMGFPLRCNIEEHIETN